MPYLPTPAIKHLLSNQEHSRPSAELQAGTLLFADLCGFTALTRRLTEQGKAGVEALVSIVNRYYALMLRQVDRFGGALIKFGGDSLLVLFSEADHAGRAAGCAIAMQQRMRRHFQGDRGAFDAPEVHMTIGLHTGTFISSHIGFPGERLEYMLTGPEVGLVLRARQVGGPDEIILSPATTARLSRRFQVRRGAAWSKLCIPPHPLALPLRREQPTAPQQLPTHCEAQLVCFLPESLRARVAAALPQHWLDGEYRHITALFIEIAGLSVTLQHALERSAAPNLACLHSLEVLHDYLLHTDRMARRYGGSLIRCDTTTYGERFLLLFGAPTMQEGSAERAALCALEILNDSRWRGKIEQRCGIATGFAFCGDVGTPARREYTVMGNAINLAARLVDQAESPDILIDETTRQHLQDSCRVQRLGLLALKGWREPIDAHRLIGYAFRGNPRTVQHLLPTQNVQSIHRQRDAVPMDRLAGWHAAQQERGESGEPIPVCRAPALGASGSRRLSPDGPDCSSPGSLRPLGYGAQHGRGAAPPGV